MKIGIMIIVCLLIGFISGISTASSLTDWYKTLNKPFFQPPNYLFGPVWTVLYICIGLSAGIVWTKTGKMDLSHPAWILFWSQLILNFFWSILFFGLRSPGWALLEISVLWVAIAFCIQSFWKIHSPAGILLIPYFLWVSFATVLNASIWWLNR